MKLEIFEYIEIRYNKKRIHSALNYQNIDEFINQLITKMSLNYISTFYLHTHYNNSKICIYLTLRRQPINFPRIILLTCITNSVM